MSKFKFILEDDAQRVEYCVEQVVCEDVVRDFTYFLKACQFAEESIANALEDIAYELCGGEREE